MLNEIPTYQPATQGTVAPQAPTQTPLSGGGYSMSTPLDPNGGMTMSLPPMGGGMGGMPQMPPQSQGMPQRGMRGQMQGRFGQMQGRFGQMPQQAQSPFAQRQRMMQHQAVPGGMGGNLTGGTIGNIGDPSTQPMQMGGQGYQPQPIMQPTPQIQPNQMSNDAMSSALRRRY